MRSGERHLFLVFVFLVSTTGSFVFGNRIRSRILGISTVSTPPPTPIVTPDPTPPPTPLATPSPTPIPTNTLVPTPKPTRTPISSEQINSFIDRFSAQYRVDSNVIRHIAICESGFNPNAVNGPYKGLFQFGTVTWEDIRGEIGEDPDPDLRLSAEDSIQTAAYAISQGKISIWLHCNP